MEYRQLGKSGIAVSAVALGCWEFANDNVWGPQDDNDSIATVHAALDRGVTFFDTAEGYGGGHSEEALGRALKGRRSEAVVATKVSPNHLRPDEVMRACEGSLQRLNTDYIDLYIIHWPDPEVPLEDTLAAMRRLQEAGKIRAIGVSNFGPRDMRHLWQLGGAEVNQVPYSLLFRAIEHAIQPACVELGMGILCYSPMAQGLLTGTFATLDEVPAGQARTRLFAGKRASSRHGEAGCEEQVLAALGRIRAICQDLGQPMATVSLAWLLQRPGVTAVLAGGRRPEEIRANAVAGSLRLDDATLRALAEATETVKACLGTNPDPWQGGANSRVH